MNAKEIRDIPQDLLVRLGEEQDMTTTDRIMESLTVLESKSDNRWLAIHGEDEPQVRAVIEKVLAEQERMVSITTTLKAIQGWLKENAPGGWIDDLRKENAALKAQIADEELVFNHANETIGKLEADLQEARKAALEEAARIADKIGEQAADGSDSLSSESIEEIHLWNDMQCHRANGCFKVASEIRKSISAPGRGQ